MPVLVDEDTTVYDSTIIDEYLEDEYPEPPLLPAIGASALRARARSLEDIADTSFTLQVGQLMAEMRKPEADRDRARLSGFINQSSGRARFPQSRAAGEQVSRRQFSVADIGFVPRLLVLKEIGLDPGATGPTWKRG